MAVGHVISRRDSVHSHSGNVFLIVACLFEISEPVGIQALGPEGSVERLDERVVGRFARPREVDLRSVLISP